MTTVTRYVDRINYIHLMNVSIALNVFHAISTQSHQINADSVD